MAKSKSNSNTTIDHEEIRKWAEERGGKPACVRGTGGKGDIGMLRLEFPGKPGANDDSLEEISWDEFFGKFDERELALILQETTADGHKSNFNKLVSRETAAEERSTKSGSTAKSGAKGVTAKSHGAKSTSGQKTTAASSKKAAGRSAGTKTHGAGG